MVISKAGFHGSIEDGKTAAALGILQYGAKAAHILDHNRELVGLVEAKQGA